MNPELSSIVAALEGKRVGSYWMVRCPVPEHDDTTPSCSICERDGKLLWKCFGGCSQTAVTAALRELGLLFSADRDISLPHLHKAQTAPKRQRRIVATHDYTDEAGELLYQVVRYDPKDFRQRHPDGRGGWIWKKGERQVLYRLPEVLEAPIIFAVEGERDVETLRDYGFVATTNAGGAKAPWLPQYTETLAGREVIIVPDADPPGIARGKRIAKALWGHAARLIWWEPDGAKDISDWFTQGHSEVELIECITVDEGVHQ